MDNSNNTVKLIGERDIPINLYSEDELDLKSQINGFAEFIMSCETPMTVSIEGGWGSGKTSFYNAVKDTIIERDRKKNENKKNDEETYVFIDFNAWQHSQFRRSDNLSIDLFNSIIKNVEDRLKKNNIEDEETRITTMRIRDGLKMFGKFAQAGMLTVANHVVSEQLGFDPKKIYNEVQDTGKMRDDITKLLRSGSDTPDGTEIISSMKEDFQKCINKSLGIDIKQIKKDDKKKHFWQRSKKASEKQADNAPIEETSPDSTSIAKNTDKRLIVFVDDLDRLVPDKALEMLEALKVFLDCKHCVFVLAIDYDVVINGVKLKYKDSISVDKGKDFFEKIIQVVYKIPLSIEHSNAFITSILKKYHIWPIIVPEFTDLIRSLGKDSPRAVKRLLNAFLLLRKIAEKQGRPAYEPTDIDYPSPNTDAYLFAFICLRESNEKLYKDFMYYSISSDDMESFLTQMDILKKWIVLSFYNEMADHKRLTPEEIEEINHERVEIEEEYGSYLKKWGVFEDKRINEKKSMFLLTFFRTLMVHNELDRVYNLELKDFSLTERDYVDRIRSALLLSDISGVNISNNDNSKNIDAIIIYSSEDNPNLFIDFSKMSEEENDSDEGENIDSNEEESESIYEEVDQDEVIEDDEINKPYIYTFIYEPANAQDALKKTLEKILNGHFDIKLKPFFNKLIYFDDDELTDPVEFSFTIWATIGGSAFHKIDAYFDASKMDNNLEQLNKFACEFGYYIEWCRGRVLKKIRTFGDSSIQSENKSL